MTNILERLEHRIAGMEVAPLSFHEGLTLKDLRDALAEIRRLRADIKVLNCMKGFRELPVDD